MFCIATIPSHLKLYPIKESETSIGFCLNFEITYVNIKSLSILSHGAHDFQYF